MNDDFDLSTFIENKKIGEFKKVLEKAAKEIGFYNEFVLSCSQFLKENGFLTPRQVEALEKSRSGNYEDAESRDYLDCDFSSIHDFDRD